MKEVSGNLYEELEEIERINQNMDEIEVLMSVTVGCTGLFTIVGYYLLMKISEIPNYIFLES